MPILSFFSNKSFLLVYIFLLCFQCDVILSSDLPIIPPSEIQINESEKLGGGSNVGNYDTHFIPVKPKTENPQEVNYIPCAKGDRAKYHEFVVFESSQCLPRYVVELEKSISSTQSSSPSIIESHVDPVSTANLVEPTTNPVTSFAPVALNPNSVQPSTLEETTLPVPLKKPQPIAKIEKAVIPVERPLPDGIEQKYRAIYKRFLRAQLIYKPNKDNNEGMITFNFSDLPNPLEGEFDLSRCGDAGQYLSINTGYRTMERSQRHSNKVEYWITTTFMVERDLSNGTRHMTTVWKNIKDTHITFTIDWNSWKMEEYWYIGKSSNGFYNLWENIWQPAGLYANKQITKGRSVDGRQSEVTITKNFITALMN